MGDVGDFITTSRAMFSCRLTLRRGCWLCAGGAKADANVFGIKEREINYLIKRTAKRAAVNEAASAHWFRHAHASHAIDNGGADHARPHRTPGRARFTKLGKG